jgi:hypothetical protein
MIIVTIDEAKILAKLLPINIVANNKSGFLRSFKALFAPLSGFFERFFNLILLAAIIPVSEPEKKALRVSKPNNDKNKNNKEGSEFIN